MGRIHCLLALVVWALVLNTPEAVPVPSEAAELVELGESPISAMVEAINHQVSSAESRARHRIDTAMRVLPMNHEIDATINKLAKLRGIGNQQESSHHDVGEGVSAVQAAMAKAKAKAKVMRALHKAQESLAKAQKTPSHKQGQHRIADDANIEELKDLVSTSIKRDMAQAHVARPEDPLDAAIDQISVVRAREKTKAKVQHQLAQASESMDLAEANDEPHKNMLLQLGGGSGMPAVPPAPPSPPNAPVAEVKKDIPASKPLARSTPKAPAGGSGLDSALNSGKGKDNSSEPVPPKKDPNISQSEMDKAIKKIAEFPMSNKEATKEGEKQTKAWDDRKKPKSRKVAGPAMKKANPLAGGSGSGARRMFYQY